MKKYVKFFALMLVCAVIFASCKKETVTPADTKTPTPVNPAYSHSGLGDNNGVPTGTFINLPSYISVVGNIVAAAPGGKSGKVPFKPNATNNYVASDKGEYTPLGAGIIGINIAFKNNLNTPTSFTLPAGLLFIDDTISTDDTTRIPQHCFMLKNVQVDLGAGETVKVQVLTYCSNHHFSSPFGLNYQFGPVSNYPGLVELCNIMKSKQHPVGQESRMQTCVWNITNEGGLTTDDRTFLNSLP